VTVTIFELHHRTVHLRSDHLLQTRRSHAHGYHENPTSSQQSRCAPHRAVQKRACCGTIDTPNRDPPASLAILTRIQEDTLLLCLFEAV
jgi:hypothetical protein